MTPQHKRIMEYVEEFGAITPAQMGGKSYHGYLWPSEIGKRCRELRNMLKLESRKKGKFQEFYLPQSNIAKIAATYEMEKHEHLFLDDLNPFFDICWCGESRAKRLVESPKTQTLL